MLNSQLNHVIKGIRHDALRKAKGSPRVVSWREKDHIGGPIDAGVVILPTKGCSWGKAAGCSMCGYVYDSVDMGQEELMEGFDVALEKLGDIQYLKIFNSGSFFDPGEISKEVEEAVIARVNALGLRRLQVESRPEFIKEERLREMVSKLECELEVGIGLETSSDLIRANCVNKGFTLEDFERAAGACKASGVQVKAYLLVKPPFLTEKEALEDMVSSAVEAWRMGASRVSFNPMNVQRGTLVERLWERREYRPPWLWSLLEILRRVKEQVDVPVLCHPTAAGKVRGAHNCGECDGAITRAIVDFSVTQDPSLLEGHECECRSRWKELLDLEGFNQSPDGPLFR